MISASMKRESVEPRCFCDFPGGLSTSMSLSCKGLACSSGLLLPRGQIQSPAALSEGWMDLAGWPNRHWTLLSHPLPCPAQPSIGLESLAN